MTFRSPVVSDLYPEEIYKIKDRVLIMLAEPWDSISATDKTLLTKILGAVKLSIEGVQIITQSDGDLSVINQMEPKWVIQFINEESGNIPFYQVTTQEGYSIIKSHSLCDLDDSRKKSLWAALKGLVQR